MSIALRGLCNTIMKEVGDKNLLSATRADLDERWLCSEFEIRE